MKYSLFEDAKIFNNCKFSSLSIFPFKLLVCLQALNFKVANKFQRIECSIFYFAEALSNGLLNMHLKIG